MKSEHIILGLFLAVAAVGFIGMVKPAFTGNVSSLQQWPAVGGIAQKTDRQCQYFEINCEIVQERPVSFETLLWKRCQAMNSHSKSCMAKCIEQGLREAQYQCPAVSPYLRVLQEMVPTMATGEVAVDANSCLKMAEEYDFVLKKTLDTAEVPARTGTSLNPCSASAETAEIRVFATEAPLKIQSRIVFNGDVYGSISGKSPGQSDIEYAICSDSSAKVAVSGIDICSTI